MKCPKCGYLGFETSDRCRNCGYDFSLAVVVDDAAELPLRSSEGTGAPLADFDLSETTRSRADTAAALDLDRLIGDAPASSPPPAAARPRGSSAASGAADDGGDPLPLFSLDDPDDTPLITTARAPRPPLAVRRTTPDSRRQRVRPTTPMLRADEAAVASAPSSQATMIDAPVERLETGRQAGVAPQPATRGARLFAALVDGVLLAAIDSVVIYLTLALAGLGTDAIAVLPILPLVGFFAILNGGYLIAFVAAGGQTLGKMATGIRVIADDGQRVDIGGAVLRAVGCVLSLLTVGLGYLPAFVTADGRALQDRISGTRVVSAR